MDWAQFGVEAVGAVVGIYVVIRDNRNQTIKQIHEQARLHAQNRKDIEVLQSGQRTLEDAHRTFTGRLDSIMQTLISLPRQINGR